MNALESFPSAALNNILLAFRRFPLPLACGLIWAVWLGFDHGPTISGIVLVAVPGFFLSLAATLFAESRGWPPIRRHLAATWTLVLLALAFAGATGAGAVKGAWYYFSYAVPLVPALVPFLGAGRTDRDFAFFFAGLAGAAMRGLLVGLVLLFILAISIPLLELLIRGSLGFFGSLLLLFMVVLPCVAGGMVFLAFVPATLGTDADAKVPGWARLLGDRFMVSAVLLLFGVLVLHALGSLFLRLPDGRTGGLVFSCLLGGTVAYLFGGLRPEEPQEPVRTFRRYFYPGLIVPALLLSAALWERVGAFGWTENRFMAAVLAAWVGSSALAALVRRHLSLRVFMALGTVLFLAAPWAVRSVAVTSQVAQLDRLIEAAAERPPTDLGRISDVLRFLLDRKSSEPVRQWLIARGIEPETAKPETLDTVLAALALRPKQPEKGWVLSGGVSSRLEVSGFDWLFDVDLVVDAQGKAVAVSPRPWLSLHLDPETADLIARVDGGREIRLPLVRDREDEIDLTASEHPVVREAAGGSYRMRLYIERLDFREDAGKRLSLRGKLLFGGKGGGR